MVSDPAQRRFEDAGAAPSRMEDAEGPGYAVEDPNGHAVRYGDGGGELGVAENDTVRAAESLRQDGRIISAGGEKDVSRMRQCQPSDAGRTEAGAQEKALAIRRRSEIAELHIARFGKGHQGDGLRDGPCSFPRSCPMRGKLQ
jgi:hypothetical protein